MAGMEPALQKQIAQGVGGCLTAFGCLFCLGGLIGLVLVVAGAINHSEELTVSAIGSSSLCCGVMALLIAAAAVFVGRRLDQSDPME